MKRKGIFITLGIIIAVIGAGAAFYFSGAYDKLTSPQATQNQPESVTLEGTVQCLPHKNSGGPTTLECAIGLKSGDKYYGLSGTTGSELAGSSGSDKKVKVTGDLQKQTSDKYTLEGVIAVKDFSFIE